MRYQKVEDGQLVTPILRGYKLQCCGCGLTHRINFYPKKGSLSFRATKDNRATAAARRGRKKFKQQPRS